MKRSVISSLALTAAMLLSTGAWAQATMIGQQTISADDLPKVQAQCDTLAGVEGGSLVKDNTTDTTNDTNASSESSAANESTAEKTEPNGADKATATINLELITIEECKAAGLSK